MSFSVPLDLAADRLPAEPLVIHSCTVLPEWIDYNGHMNVAYYVLAFDHATDRLLDMLDLGANYVKRENNSVFVLETHVGYLQEVVEGDQLEFRLWMIDADDKRLHFYTEMHHAEEDYLAATSEIIAVHVDLDARRSAVMPKISRQRCQAILAAQTGLERPAKVGASIGLKRKK